MSALQQTSKVGNVPVSREPEPRRHKVTKVSPGGFVLVRIFVCGYKFKRGHYRKVRKFPFLKNYT